MIDNDNVSEGRAGRCCAVGFAYLVALSPYPRGTDKGQAESTFLRRVLDVVQDQSVAREDLLDLCFHEGHVDRVARRES